jgi:DNA-binding LacI/PurR family transcriptional regulator
LAADLRRRLMSGEWRTGMPVPSCRELAVSYGVGYQVARLALKTLGAEGHIRLESRRAARASFGAPLCRLISDVVALILTRRIHNAFGNEERRSLWRGIERALGENQYPLLVLHHEERWRTENPAGLRELPLRGLLLVGPFAQTALRHYENLSIPAVLIDQPGTGLNLHSVAVANHQAAYDATKRVIEKGHRRIAFVRTITRSINAIDPDSKERESGFVAACTEAGFKNSQYAVFSAFAGQSRKTSSAAAELINFVPRFTAVITDNPGNAEHLAVTARLAGLEIPRMLSIVTFHAAGHGERDWTGPQSDFEKLGRAGVDILRHLPKQFEQFG